MFCIYEACHHDYILPGLSAHTANEAGGVLIHLSTIEIFSHILVMSKRTEPFLKCEKQVHFDGEKSLCGL